MISYNGLKVFLEADIPLAETFRWRNDKRIWKWCRQHTLLSMEDHYNYLKNLWSSEHKMFAVHDLISKECVGVCGLTNIDKLNQKAEFSLYIAPDCQQVGYGKHALLSLLRHGFHDHNLNCIWGETYDGNHSTKMFEAIGMTKEGTLRQRYFRDGRFIDTHVYSLTRDDFGVVGPRYFGDLLPLAKPTHDSVPTYEKNTEVGAVITIEEGLPVEHIRDVPYDEARGKALDDEAKGYSAFGSSGSGA
jgi:RimJ/RimL family protein N-acetyltransferase